MCDVAIAVCDPFAAPVIQRQTKKRQAASGEVALLILCVLMLFCCCGADDTGRAIGGDWLFDVALWVHEWDRLMMLLWEAHLAEIRSSSSSSSSSRSSSSKSKYHVSLLRSELSSS